MRDRWDITEQVRDSVVQRLRDIMEDEDTDPKEVISAAKVIASLDKQSTDLTEAVKTMTLSELKGELIRRLTLEAAPLDLPKLEHQEG